jgi:uridylate kinase
MSFTTIIISLGGSLICPEFQPSLNFLLDFREVLRAWLREMPDRRAVIISGGGGPARLFQQAARNLNPHTPNEQLDWIGIRATWLNGELVRSLFAEDCKSPLVIDPSQPPPFEGRVMVAAGWKPGFSTDFDAVLLAEKFGATTLLNLSNISHVYTANPKEDPTAHPIEEMSWDDFQRLVGTDWKPGSNLPFDPIATARAKALNLEVIVAGPSLENLKSYLKGLPFAGTRIRPKT